MDDKVFEMGNGGYTPTHNTYERSQHEKALEERKSQMIRDIASVEKEILEFKDNTLRFMDLLEKVVNICGGENKLMFLDVSYTFIKVRTRVPMEANLFNFLKESADNPRFHKVVTKILLLCPHVSEVRWLPASDGDRGSYLFVGLKRGGDTK